MRITICVGSSCHLKGSRQVVEQLQKILAQNNIHNTAELCGAFCMDHCVKGVCVKIDDKLFSVQLEDVRSFFDSEIKGKH